MQSRVSTHLRLITTTVLIILVISGVTSAFNGSSVSIRNSGFVGTSTLLFQTGFEAGDLSEVDTEQWYNGILNVTTLPAHSGMYSARVYGKYDPIYGGDNPRARIFPKLPWKQVDGVWTWGGDNEGYIRTYVYLRTWQTYIQLIRTCGHDPVYDKMVYFARVVVYGGSIVFQLGMVGKYPGLPSVDWEPVDSQGNVFTEIEVPVPQFQLERWYSIEMHYKRSSGKGIYDGGAQIWVDGNPVLDKMDVDTSGFNQIIDYVAVGIVLMGAGENEIFVDDLVVKNSYIGPM